VHVRKNHKALIVELEIQFGPMTNRMKIMTHGMLIVWEDLNPSDPLDTIPNNLLTPEAKVLTILSHLLHTLEKYQASQK
jgi:hypothetical protein